MAVYSYTPTKNAALKSSSPNTNFSADTQNRIYHNDLNTIFEYIAFFYNVDLSSAPLLHKAITAKLKLYVVSKSGDNNARLNLISFGASWAENTITYNNKPTLEASLNNLMYLSQISTGWADIGVTLRPDTDFQPIVYGFALRFDPQYGPESSTSLTIQTSRGTNKPTLEITTADVPLVISNRLPAGGFVYAGAPKTFSWTTAVGSYSGDLIGTITQASAKLRYRKVGVTPYTEISLSGATNSHTFASGTFDGNSNYEWQVEVTSNDSVVTTSSWIQFSTIDATPDKPTPISPINVYEKTDQEIGFEWQHVINTGTPQTKADLQYSYDGGAWTDLATVTGSANTYTAPANTLPAGNLRWRVRTYNTDDVEGDWSDPVAFGGIGSPPAAVISEIPQSSRPTFEWQSVGQVGYQLILLQGATVLYDTLETYGAGKTLTLPMYLANGDYTVQLRIKNASLLWSDWAEIDFTLAVTPPSAPTVTAAQITDGARITISGVAEGITHMYLLRNGVPMADITGLTQYDDYAALGATTYVVRVVDENENYADSSPAVVTVTLIGAVLAVVDDLSDTVRMTQKSIGQPAVSRQKQYIGSAHNYAGREYPVYTFSEFSNDVLNPSYFYTDRADWDALEALADLRKTVLYRDMLGNRLYGVITVMNSGQDEERVSFVLTIQRVDYVEQIDFAEVAQA